MNALLQWMAQLPPLEIGVIISILMLALVVAGLRVAFAAATAGFCGLLWIFASRHGFDKGLSITIQVAGTIPHSKISSYALSLIPVFILIGFLAFHAGLTRALFEAAKRWLGALPGGMALATIFSTAGFAAVSGASVATSAVFARIALPEMLRMGYQQSFAAGVVAAGGTLAALIPPSAILVIYAIIVEQDVGALLMAGFLPGLFSALVYGAMVVGMAIINPTLGPAIATTPMKERWASLPPTFPVFAVIGAIIICIYGGVGTPTEAGSLGAMIIFIVALIKGMKWKDFKESLLETVKFTVMIFTIIWGVLIYVRFLGFADLPNAFAAWISNLEQSPYITLILILCVFAILGMFMDAIGMLLLTLPVVYPAVIALNGGEGVSVADSAFGVSEVGCAVWFGIIAVKMAELCLITPPIGLNCFVVSGVSGCSVQDVFRGCAPFFVADIVTIIILLFLPNIVLWLPMQVGLVP